MPRTPVRDIPRRNYDVQRDTEFLADAPRVLQVRGRRAVAVVVVPVAHEERVHLAALADEQGGGNRGIHAARDAEHDAIRVHTRIIVRRRLVQPLAASEAGAPGSRCEMIEQG